MTIKGKRNFMICLAALAATTWLGHAGIVNGTDPVGLASIIGAQWVGTVGLVFGRGYNKMAEVRNGGVQ